MRPRPCWPGVGRRSTGHRLIGRVGCERDGKPCDGACVTSHQPLSGRQPLCGMGVTSRIQVTSMPMFCRVLTGVPARNAADDNVELANPCSPAATGRLLPRPGPHRESTCATRSRPTHRGPSNGCAGLVADRDNRVVETRLDVAWPWEMFLSPDDAHAWRLVALPLSQTPTW